MLPGPQNGLNYIMKSLVFSLFFIHFDIIMGIWKQLCLCLRGDIQHRGVAGTTRTVTYSRINTKGYKLTFRLEFKSEDTRCVC